MERFRYDRSSKWLIEHIDARARPEEHANLLAVTQVFTGLRYNAPQVLAIFGGREAEGGKR